MPRTEEYLSATAAAVSTDTWYWTSRLIAALADASFKRSQFHIERYTFAVQSAVRKVIGETDRKVKALEQAMAGASAKPQQETAGVSAKPQQNIDGTAQERVTEILLDANRQNAQILREASEKVLEKVLNEASNIMRNQYSRSDA